MKHDPATIAALYAAEPARVAPSELAPQHWSKVTLLDGEPEPWVCALVDRSYELVLARQSKAGRAAIAAITGERNAFLDFHREALVLREREGVHLAYSDVPEQPNLSVHGYGIACFRFHRLQLLREGADPVNASDDDFEELRLDDAGAWRAALRRAVEDALVAARVRR